jgi:hypothetical protein
MRYPFTKQQFLALFENYNLSIWPVQIAAYALGVACIVLAMKKTRYSGKIIAGILFFFWLWTGIVFYILFFARINSAAYVFGGIFIVQGIIFLILGFFGNELSFGFLPNIYWYTGAAFILYAVVVYPILGYLQGRGYPYTPMFGVAPCPTAIFTFGVLLWADRRVFAYFVIIPLIWSIIGFFAAVSVGVAEDFGLLVAGFAGTTLILIKNRRIR